MVGAARILWNRGEGRFQRAKLIDHPYKLTETGVIADMNGDSHPDLMSTRARGDLVLYLGDAEGRFPDEPKLTPRFEQPLRGPSSLTVGDIDGDGDLDVWLAQYKPPYRGGQMPTPYYDANDGFPSYLLLNDGQGNFSHGTAAAGLEAKRFRRTYASTFVDLVVVEDHGLNGQKLHVYRNRLETGNHWIGVRLLEEGNGISPVGASVSVHTAEQTHMGQIVTGETILGQHPTTLHFGLGSSIRVESIEVRWPNGMTRIVHDPEIDRHHRIVAPGADRLPPP